MLFYNFYILFYSDYGGNNMNDVNGAQHNNVLPSTYLTKVLIYK